MRTFPIFALLLLTGCGGYIEEGSNENFVLLEGGPLIINNQNSAQKAAAYCMSKGKPYYSFISGYTNPGNGHLHYKYGCFTEADKQKIIADAHEKQKNTYTETCKSLGFKKGTDAFANCAMKIREEKIQNDQKQAALAAQYQAKLQEEDDERARRVAAVLAENARQQRERAAAQQPIQTNCSQVGFGYNCTTYR